MARAYPLPKTGGAKNVQESYCSSEPFLAYTIHRFCYVITCPSIPLSGADKAPKRVVLAGGDK
jgi:hypothetical protein